jgi:hypothetical protein
MSEMERKWKELEIKPPRALSVRKWTKHGGNSLKPSENTDHLQDWSKSVPNKVIPLTAGCNLQRDRERECFNKKNTAKEHNIKRFE